jgi:hypothetical protein
MLTTTPVLANELFVFDVNFWFGVILGVVAAIFFPFIYKLITSKKK